MSEKTTAPAAADQAAPEVAFNSEASIAGAAAFADAESREILNLLGGDASGDDAGGCCGGGCCSV